MSNIRIENLQNELRDHNSGIHIDGLLVSKIYFR